MDASCSCPCGFPTLKSDRRSEVCWWPLVLLFPRFSHDQGPLEVCEVLLAWDDKRGGDVVYAAGWNAKVCTGGSCEVVLCRVAGGCFHMRLHRCQRTARLHSLRGLGCVCVCVCLCRSHRRCLFGRTGTKIMCRATKRWRATGVTSWPWQLTRLGSCWRQVCALPAGLSLCTCGPAAQPLAAQQFPAACWRQCCLPAASWEVSSPDCCSHLVVLSAALQQQPTAHVCALRPPR